MAKIAKLGFCQEKTKKNVNLVLKVYKLEGKLIDVFVWICAVFYLCHLWIKKESTNFHKWETQMNSN